MKAVCAALASVLASGCSTSATLVRSPQYGGSLDAYVIGSNPANVLVAGPDGPVSIPRNHIDHIDHPGNVHILIGAALSLVGLLDLATGSQCDSGPNTICVGPMADLLLLGGGLALTTWGAMVWGRSRNAEQPPVVPAHGAPLGLRPPGP
jgi:hypothetical protein